MVRETVIELAADALARESSALGLRFALTPQNDVELIDIAKLAIACEAAFHITLHDEAVAEWRTLGDACAHIERLLDEGEAEPTERDDYDRVAWFYE